MSVDSSTVELSAEVGMVCVGVVVDDVEGGEMMAGEMEGEMEAAAEGRLRARNERKEEEEESL